MESTRLKVSEQAHRSHAGPFFGWLNAWLKPYPRMAGSLSAARFACKPEGGILGIGRPTVL